MSVSLIAHLMQKCNIMIMTAYLVLSPLVLSCLEKSNIVIYPILFPYLAVSDQVCAITGRVVELADTGLDGIKVQHYE